MEVAVWIGGQEEVKQVTFVHCAARHSGRATHDLRKILRHSECIGGLTVCVCGSGVH